MDARQIIYMILLLFGIYVLLVYSVIVGLVIAVFSATLFITSRRKSEPKWITSFTKMYMKASESMLGAKDRLPTWHNLELGAINHIEYRSPIVSGGVFALAQIHSCECGAPNHAILIPYLEEDEENPTIDNIYAFLDHETEPRSAPQIRRLLSSLGIKESIKDEVTKRLANELVTGYQRHRRRFGLRSPIVINAPQAAQEMNQ